ncbi:unnamed protein product (macronuclear) [Paramecium tetraurelia]|uniref:EGF-like domain-containing protein n=1 Tax=Paramecium tetraurelia TaxID=5888 RepID=A0CC66_PARTE|nr:uncharacterized protein GSPATT00037167001 [Paramecium tetraurelia]CAK68383.1 unnamed protein product [Paramecium tetraurelia]|eukprot:XP_001435780.1 hypothetical protein (macronuclear) [Paramecium tetraurelia strain d4-2]
MSTSVKPVLNDVIERDYTSKNIIGYGMWHRWIPMQNTTELKKTTLPYLQLIYEFDTLKTAMYSKIYMINALDTQSFYIVLEQFGSYTLKNQIALDNIMIEGRWAYLYYCQNIAAGDFRFYYKLLIDSNYDQTYVISGIENDRINRRKSGFSAGYITIIPEETPGYLYFGQKSEILFKDEFYDTITDFNTALSVACSFPDVCSIGKQVTYMFNNIYNFGQLGAKMDDLFYAEGNYVISAWIKLDQLNLDQNKSSYTALRLAIFDFYADDYLQGDRQLWLNYQQDYEFPENTKISVHTFSFIFAQLTFYQTKEDDKWSIQGLKYEDQVTQWHYFSFQHGSFVEAETGYGNTKIYFQFKDFEITDYYVEKKNHFSTQQLVLIAGRDKYAESLMKGQMAFLKLEYCFGNTFTMVKDCNVLCKECVGPEVNQCTSCQASQFRVLTDNQCLCKRNYVENTDKTLVVCQSFTDRVGSNIFQEASQVNTCQQGQFLIKNGNTQQCLSCPTQMSDISIQCGDCYINSQEWYLNPICTFDYQAFNSNPNNAFKFIERMESAYQLFTISGDLNLELCPQCLKIVTDTSQLDSNKLITQYHLGVRSTILCKSCSKSVNNQCVDQNENCDQCDSHYVCQSCQNGFKLVSNQFCRQCPDSCTECTFIGDMPQCTSCPIGFYLSGGKCTQCGWNCLICDAQRCFKCVNYSQYYISLDGQNCYENKITNCLIAYEESVSNSSAISLLKDYPIVQRKDDVVVKCALCVTQSINKLTSCVIDFNLPVSSRYLEQNGQNVQLSATNLPQGSYQLTNQTNTTSMCDSDRNCKSCVLEDRFYQDSWKIDITSFYNTNYGQDFLDLVLKTNDGDIKCVTCLKGYDYLNGKCIKSCDSNCKVCQIINEQAICIQCTENWNGQRLTLSNGECIECPYNCALCQQRDAKSLSTVNPYFDPTKADFIKFSYICLKSFTIPTVNLNYDFDLENFVECSSASTCKQKALIDLKLYCNKKSLTVLNGYDQDLTEFTSPKYESDSHTIVFNQKVLKEITIKMRLINDDSTLSCKLPDNFQIISDLRKNVFTLKTINLEFYGTTNVIFNENFIITGFNQVLLKDFTLASTSKNQTLYIYDQFQFELILNSITLKVVDISFSIVVENATSITIDQFAIQDSRIINSIGIVQCFGSLKKDDVTLQLTNIDIKNSQFTNSKIFLFKLSENYNNLKISIQSAVFTSNVFRLGSQAFRTDFPLNVRMAVVDITQFTQTSDELIESTFASFEGVKRVNINQIALQQSKLSAKSRWLILPLFSMTDLQVKNNILSTDDVILISNKASVQYSDANDGNTIDMQTIKFELNKYLGNKAFMEIYQTTFVGLKITIDDLLIDQNELYTLTKLQQKYIASENSTLYFDSYELTLTNTKIVRGKTFPEMAILNSNKVQIDNMDVTRNSDILKLLNNRLSCVSANAIPQIYTTILYLYNIKEIDMNHITLYKIKSINQPLISIKSSDRLKIRQKESIRIRNSIFSENLLILSKISELQAIISIISEQNQDFLVEDSKFLYNFQHSYISDLSFVSSSTLLFSSPNSSVILNRNNFEKNIATNGQNSNLVLKCNSITITTCSFLYSNQLYFNVIHENIVWGLESFTIPKQEEFYQAFPIKTFGGSAYLSANTTTIKDVNIIGSISLLGGAIYLQPQSDGVVKFQDILFQECRASLEQVSNAQGGTIFIDASSSQIQMTISNCTFLNSYSRREGGVIYVIPSSSENNMYLEDVLIQDSYSIYYSFIKTFGSNLLNLDAQNLTLQNSYQGFKQYLGQLYQLSQSEISDYHLNYIFSIKGKITLQNSSFTDYMNGLIEISNGELIMKNVIVSNYITGSQPLISLSSISVIIMQNVQFLNISVYSLNDNIVPECEVSYTALALTCDYSQIAPTFIEIDMNQTIIDYYSILNLKNVQLAQNYPTSLISVMNIDADHSIVIQDTKFQEIICQKCSEGLIQFQFLNYFKLGNNIISFEKFQLQSSQCGQLSCIVLQQQFNQNRLRLLVDDSAKNSLIYTVTVRQSIFSNNFGTNGGVFHVNDINILFDDCKFQSNIASESGGAIYFISKQATLNIYDSEINGNQAAVGGAFFLQNYTLNSPSILNLQLRNNKAQLFGQNYAEYPNQLTLSLNGGVDYLEKERLFANLTTIIDVITIQPYNVSNTQKDYITLPSGQAINTYKYFDEETQQYLSYNLTFRIIALNKQDNKIQNLDGSKCTIFSRKINLKNITDIDPQNIENVTSNQTSPYTSMQEVNFNTTSQDYNLDEMIVYFDPKSNSQAVLQIEFLCSSIRIPMFNPEPPYLLKYQIENYRLRVNVQSFDCQVGEQKRDEDGTCLVCDSQQDQYSVIAGETCQVKDTISTEAVTSASVKLRPGYWRPYSYSTRIEYCLNMQINCEGGWTPGDSSCFSGHIGALCEQCDIYNIMGNGQWSVSAQYKCGSCNDVGDNSIKVALISTWTLISIMLSVKSTMEAVNNMIISHKFSKYFVEQTKAGQGGILIKVLTNYLQIIGAVQTFQLSLPSALTSAFKTVGSPVESMSYSLDCFLIKISDINVMYFRMIWALIMPIIYILTFFILYGIAILLRQADASKSAITTTFIYLFTYLQPTLLGGFVSLLSFRQVSNIFWVQGNVAYRYDTAQHLKWVLSFVFPSAFTLGLIIPTYMFLSMYKIKNDLNDGENRKKWGYLYNEYQPKAYFWEIVKIFQKSFIILFLTFYEDLIIIKAALIFIIVFIYSLLTKKYKPFKLPYLNYLDDMSTLVCGTSIVLGMTLYSANQTSNQEIIWPFYIFLIIINGVFIAIILWEILWAQLDGQEEALDKLRNKINVKFPNLSNKNWLTRKLFTNRAEQRARIKKRFRMIREYLMGIVRNENRKRDHLYQMNPLELSDKEKDENDSLSPDINPTILSVPRFYNKIYPEVFVDQYGYDHQSQADLSRVE